MYDMNIYSRLYVQHAGLMRRRSYDFQGAFAERTMIYRAHL